MSIYRIGNRTLLSASLSVLVCPDAPVASRLRGGVSMARIADGRFPGSPMPLASTSYAGIQGSNPTSAIPKQDLGCWAAPRAIAVAENAVISRTWSAASLHPHELNALAKDGSVRFIKDTIDSWSLNKQGIPVGPDGTFTRKGGVWQVLVTRNGGEVINNDSSGKDGGLTWSKDQAADDLPGPSVNRTARGPTFPAAVVSLFWCIVVVSEQRRSARRPRPARSRRPSMSRGRRIAPGPCVSPTGF